MSNLRVFDPFVSDSMEPFFRRFFAPASSETGIDAHVPKIRIDVEENEKSYLVHADIPGVKKENISVRINGNIVQIDAQSHRDKETKEKGRVIRSERHFGASSRTFSLAHEVDESKSIAKYENGVLSLVLPIQESTGTKRLIIQ